MYYYVIQDGEYDSRDPQVIAHEEYISKPAFNSMVQEAYNSYKENRFTGVDKEKIISYLCMIYNFKRLTIEHTAYEDSELGRDSIYTVVKGSD